MRPLTLPNDATGNVIVALDAMLGRRTGLSHQRRRLVHTWTGRRFPLSS